MKKIFLILLLFFLFPIGVFAQEKDWSIYQDDNSNMEIKIEYRFFKEVKQGIYTTASIPSFDYAYTDEEDFYYGLPSAWNLDCREDGVNIIEKATITPIQRISPIRFIKIINQGEKFRYTSLKIMRDQEEIPYQIDSCVSCDGEYLNPGGEVLLYIKDEFYIDDVEFLSEEANYQIHLNNRKDFTKTIAIKNIDKQLSFRIEVGDLVNKIYTQMLFIEGEHTYNGFNRIYVKKQMCRRYTKYIYRYNLVKEYAEGYYEELEGYQKDVDQYRIIYKMKESVEEENKEEDKIKEETQEEHQKKEENSSSVISYTLVENKSTPISKPAQIFQREILYLDRNIHHNQNYAKAHFYIYFSLIFLILLLNGIILKNMSKKQV